MSKRRRPRGTGFVRERGNSRLLVVRVGERQYSRAVKTATKREALAMLPAFVAEVHSGKVDDARAAVAKAKEAPTFNDAVATFLEREIGIDQTATRQSYSNSLRRIGKVLGDNRVSEIDKHMIRNVLLAVNRESALNTTKLVHCALGRFFRNLADLDIIKASPVQTLKALRLPPPGCQTIRRDALTGSQVVALLEACADDSELRLWVELMVATGMRPGEALALRWCDIDFDRRAVRVVHSVKDGNARGHGKLGSTKNAGSVREVPLGSAIALSLGRAYLERETTYRSLGLAIEDSDCVFAADLIDGRKAPRSTGSMAARFKRARDRAGLKGVTPHCLRHTFATAAIAGTDTMPGVSMVDAAALLGHSNSAMVAKVYGHAVRENLARGVALADALIAPVPAPPANITPIAAAGARK